MIAMKYSYQHYRQLYQSFEDERLMKQWLRGNLSHNSEAALKVELKHRGLDCTAETSNLLELSDSAIEREVNRGSVWKALFRMLSIAGIFFMMALFLTGHPSLGGTADMQTLLGESLRWVALGPSLFVSQFSQNVGLIISVIFWTSLIVTALGSGDTRVQRWFYGLLGCFIGLTLLNLALTVSWDFIAAAIAKHLSA
jgi:hypothetical protein